MRVKIFADLSQKAIKLGRAKELWLWSVLRAIDSRGRGWIEMERLTDVWPQGRRNLAYLRAAGNGDFWHENAGRLFIVSPMNVGLLLESTLGDAVYVPFERVNTLRRFKAHAYAAFFSRRKTISRFRLMELFGATETTLRYWEDIAGVRVTKNIARGQLNTEAKDGVGLPPAVTDADVYRRGKTFYWQLPNTYASDLEVAPKHYRDDRRLRQATDEGNDRATGRKMYYYDPKEAYRAYNDGLTSIYVLSHERWGRRPLWDFLS